MIAAVNPMSYVSDRPAPGQVDPKDLTPRQLAALRLIAGATCARVKGGWIADGKKVTLATVSFLHHKRLVIQKIVNGRQRLQVTGTGANTLAVAEQRNRP